MNDGDLPAFLALMHQDVELTTSGAYPDFDATYRGHLGAVEYWEAARELWEAFSIEIGRCELVGDQVLVLVRQQVEGRDGIVVEHDWGHLFWFEDDLIRGVRAYMSWTEAAQAAGLRAGPARPRRIAKPAPTVPARAFMALTDWLDRRFGWDRLPGRLAS